MTNKEKRINIRHIKCVTPNNNYSFEGDILLLNNGTFQGIVSNQQEDIEDSCVFGKIYHNKDNIIVDAMINLSPKYRDEKNIEFDWNNSYHMIYDPLRRRYEGIEETFNAKNESYMYINNVYLTKEEQIIKEEELLEQLRIYGNNSLKYPKKVLNKRA
jgi:hypothetical protein